MLQTNKIPHNEHAVGVRATAIGHPIRSLPFNTSCPFPHTAANRLVGWLWVTELPPWSTSACCSGQRNCRRWFQPAYASARHSASRSEEFLSPYRTAPESLPCGCARGDRPDFPARLILATVSTTAWIEPRRNHHRRAYRLMRLSLAWKRRIAASMPLDRTGVGERLPAGKPLGDGSTARGRVRYPLSIIGVEHVVAHVVHHLDTFHLAVDHSGSSMTFRRI